jgi:hypothetical protein
MDALLPTILSAAKDKLGAGGDLLSLLGGGGIANAVGGLKKWL